MTSWPVPCGRRTKTIMTVIFFLEGGWEEEREPVECKNIFSFLIQLKDPFKRLFVALDFFAFDL